MNEFKVKKGLVVNGSGSVILDVQGSQGQLFSVTDQLSGSLFSVNDISGMPILAVSSDDSVKLGTFNKEAIKVSGSNATVTGSFTGSLSGSLFGTASWASNATTASYVLNAVSASFATNAANATTASYVLQAVSASFATNAVTASYVLNAVSASQAATASSADNFLVRGTLTAQTIVAQTITSSTDFVTGSTRFGSLLANTHQFTGSVSMTGSLTINGDGLSIVNSNASYVSTIFRNLPSYAININDTVSRSGLTVRPSSAGGETITFSRNVNNIQIQSVDTGSNVQSLSLNPFGGNVSIGKPLPTFNLDISGSTVITGSLTVTQGITGSLFGTSSWAQNAVTSSYILNAVSASFASTASFVNTLNQSVIISGSLTVGQTTTGAGENTLILGPAPAGGAGEGGQLLLAASGGLYTSASMLDNWQNQTRLLRGTNAGSDAVIANFNMHSGQITFPRYSGSGAFSGSAVANLSVDSNGNVITTAIGSSLTGGATNYVARWASATTLTTGSLFDNGTNVGIGSTSPAYKLDVNGDIRATGAVYANANGVMYFRGGDDAELWDINVANTLGVYGQQDQTVGSIKLGSGGGTISGRSGSIGINITTPTSASLHVSGNVFATSFTGSLLGTATTASYVLQAVSASFATNAVSASFSTQANTSFTASSADNFLVRGTLTAQTIVAQVITSSTDFVTGSTRFGSLLANTHQFTGSVSMTGSLLVNNSLTLTGSLLISGSSPLIQLGSTTFVGDITNPAITFGSTSNGIFLDTSRVFFKAGGSFAGGFSSDGIMANQILIRATSPNDLTTAMYIPYRLSTIGLLGGLGGNSAGDITLITSGSVRLYISSSGNVGIGTTTPAASLEISTAETSTLRLTRNNNTANYLELRGGSNGGIYNINTSGTQDHIFQTAGSEKLRITSAGNVGINNSSPGAKLDVIGSGGSGDAAMKSWYGNYSVLGEVSTIANRNGVWSTLYVFETGSSATNAIFVGGTKPIIFNAGNVGIGTTSPSSILDASVSSGATSGFRFKGYSDASTPYLLSLGTQTYQDVFQIKSVNGLVTMGMVGAVGSTPDLAFQTNTTERMRILSGGNVGIGTTAPQQALHISTATTYQGIFINGNQAPNVGFNISNATTPRFKIGISGHNADAFSISSGSAATDLLFISASGNVGIGTILPSAKLDVNGNAVVSGSLTVITGSNIEFQVLQTGVKLGNAGTDTITLTGSLNVSSSNVAANLRGSGSGVFSIDGTSGRLFQVDDSLTGSLFSVNTAAGLPIIEAFSDNTVRIGQYGRRALFVSQSAVGIGKETLLNGVLDISGSANITGSLNVSGSITGSLFGTASWANNATTSSYVLNAVSASFATNAVSASYVLQAVSASFATNAANSTSASFASTASSADNFLVRGTLTAQTIVAQVITSSTDFVTGSTRFGTLLANTHQFTGSVSITGSLIVNNVISATSEYRLNNLSYARVATLDSGGGFGGGYNFNWNNGTPIHDSIGSMSAYGYANDGTIRFYTSASAPAGTAAQERLRITAAGNVGIGTTSPSSTLHINGGGDQSITIQSTTTASTTSAFIKYIRSTTGSARTWWTGVGIQGGADDSYSFYDQTAGAERMRINNSGSVGIGTTAPLGALEITSTGASRGVVITATGLIYQKFTSDALYIQTQASAGNTVLNSSSGNVGIGTTSPTDRLQVVASTYNGITITTPDVATLKMRSSGGGTTNWGFATTNLAASDFGIYESNSAGGDPINAGTARLYFRTGGNVGIGTTSPTYKLEVNGNLASLNSTASGVFTVSGTRSIAVQSFSADWNYLRSNGAPLVFGTQDSQTLYIRTNDTDRVTINTSGNVGIGTTSPTARLHVSGTTGGVFEVDGASAVTALYVSASGNVGIGTTIPSGSLDIYGTTGAKVRIGFFTDQGADDPTLRMFDGKLTRPAYSFTSDNTSGMFGGTGFVAFSTSANERMRITSGGNVGIGTTTPTLATLQVNGNVFATSFTGSFSGSFAGTITNATSASFASTASFVANAFIQGGNSFGAQALLGTNDVQNLAFETSGSVRMLISGSNGYIGIGTTAPTYSLDVAGTSGNDGVVRSRRIIATGGTAGDPSITTTSTIAGLFEPAYGNLGFSAYAGEAGRIETAARYWNIGMTGGTAKFNIRGSGSSSATNALVVQNSTPSTLFVIQDNGNVGIGYTSPGYKLDVSGSFNFTTGGNYLTYNSGILYHGNYYQFPSGDNYLLYARTSGSLIFGSNDIERLRITSGGNVGIGTTSPSVKLHVIGDTILQSTSTGDGTTAIRVNNSSGTQVLAIGAAGGIIMNLSAKISVDVSPTSTQPQLELYNGSTGNATLQSSTSYNLLLNPNGGNVGIGTTSPGSSLHVAGNITSAPSGSGIHLGYASNFYGVIQLNGVSGSVIDFSSTGVDTRGRLLYDNANNYLDISTNSAFAMRINSSGSIGIGTTSPYSKLDVIGTIAINGAAFATNSSTYTQIYKAQSNSIGIYLGGSGDPTNYYDNTTHYFRSSGGGSTYVTINSTGVGIGTTSPSVPLHVIGNILVTGTSPIFSGGALEIQGSVNAVKTFYINRYGVANGSQHRLRAENAYFEIASANSEPIVLTGGNVGIGTTSPVSKLEVYSSLNASTFTGITVTNGAGAGSEQSRSGIAFKAYDWVQSAIWHGRNTTASLAGALVFGTNPDTTDLTVGGVVGRMWILNNGNIGIGTTTPGYKLDITSVSAADGLRVRNTTSNIPTIALGVTDVANSDWTIQNRSGNLTFNGGSVGGNVGIGTTSPAYKLDVSGSINIAASNYYRIGGSAVAFVSGNEIIYGNQGGSQFVTISTGTTEKLRIQTDGNVGIGTTAPTSKLHTILDSGQYAQFGGPDLTAGVIRGIRFGYGTGTSYWKSAIIQEQTGDAAARGKIHILNNNQFGVDNASLSDARLTIISDGNVGIGSTSPGAKLDVSGSVRATSFTGSFSGSLTGLASNATSASFAATASYATNLTVASTLVLDATLTDYASVGASSVGSNNLFSQNTSSYTSAFFKYTCASASNARSGEVVAVWNGATVQFTDFSTVDVGTTTAITSSVVIVTGQVQFNMQTNTSGWAIKSIATFM